MSSKKQGSYLKNLVSSGVARMLLEAPLSLTLHSTFPSLPSHGKSGAEHIGNPMKMKTHNTDSRTLQMIVDDIENTFKLLFSDI